MIGIERLCWYFRGHVEQCVQKIFVASTLNPQIGNWIVADSRMHNMTHNVSAARLRSRIKLANVKPKSMQQIFFIRKIRNSPHMWHPQHVALLHSNICVRNYLRCLCGNFPEQYWNWTIGNLHCDSSQCNAETLCVFSDLDKSLTKGEKMMESPCEKFMNSDRIYGGHFT